MLDLSRLNGNKSKSIHSTNHFHSNKSTPISISLNGKGSSNCCVIDWLSLASLPFLFNRLTHMPIREGTNTPIYHFKMVDAKIHEQKN